MGFINWWKERCLEELHVAPFTKRKMAKEVKILDNEMQSRYDKIHGDEGLYCALVEQFNAVAEIRVKAEYGDYLAFTALKGEAMNDMIWKIEKSALRLLAVAVLLTRSSQDL